MSLLKQYYEELGGRSIIERPWGFVTYVLYEEECYIEDVYVIPEERRNGRCEELESLVVKQALKNGIYIITGSVMPSNKTSTEAMKMMLARGYRIYKAEPNFIGLSKELKNVKDI